MNKLMVILVLMCIGSWLVSAQEATKDPAPEVVKESKQADGKWHGYIVDAMCAKNMMKKGNAMEKAAKHSRDCDLEEACAASGFGVFYDGKYYKFDEQGDKMAKEMIEKSATDKGLMADVTGALADDKITVASITEMKMEKKEMGKKAGDATKKMQKEEHKH